MWSSPCRTAIHRTPSSSSPYRDRPVRVITSPAICAHSSPLTGSSVPPGPAHPRMPARPLAPPLAQGGARLVQQPEQPPEIPCPVRAQRRLQLSRMPPARNDMRVRVFLPAARAVQVVDQALAPLAALVRAVRDLPDHRGAASAVTSRPPDHPPDRGPAARRTARCARMVQPCTADRPRLVRDRSRTSGPPPSGGGALHWGRDALRM